MIQAVADDEERGELGMHYTSVPNILKVLNPLFLDDLRAKLEEAADNARKLSTCASASRDPRLRPGVRLGELPGDRLQGDARDRARDQPAARRVGPEVRDPAHQLSRDRAPRLRRRDRPSRPDHRRVPVRCSLSRPAAGAGRFLPLDAQNWITCGNALRIDWLSMCPPTGTERQAARRRSLSTRRSISREIDFENAGGETYICGNPPYHGATRAADGQKERSRGFFERRIRDWGSARLCSGMVHEGGRLWSGTRRAVSFRVHELDLPRPADARPCGRWSIGNGPRDRLRVHFVQVEESCGP